MSSHLVTKVIVRAALILATIYVLFQVAGEPNRIEKVEKKVEADPKLQPLLDPQRFPDKKLVFSSPDRREESSITLEEYQTACKNAMLLSDDISSHKWGYGVYSELFQTGAATIVPGELQWINDRVCVGDFTVSGTLKGTPYVKKGYATVSMFELIKKENDDSYFLLAVTNGPREWP